MRPVCGYECESGVQGGGGLEIRVHKTPTALVPPSRNVASATALALPNGETQRSNYYRTGERIYLSWGFVLFFPAPAYAAPVTGASWIALWRKRENDEDEPSSQHWKQRSPSPIPGSAYYVYLLSGCTLRHTLTFPMEQILESIKNGNCMHRMKMAAHSLLSCLLASME